ncbi:MAG: cob(I)yrinic acid a,c-diamide adenosyltransferase [Dehalococcoidaceae bacterium]|nr:cob(I)yrinic acid a,c-diamide adenosyltransferase [Dehalococcoidaceae bacterium]
MLHNHDTGRVIIFTGDGKGKTTAAIGTGVRAAGHGLKVIMVMFMKGVDYVHGEIQALRDIPNFEVVSFGQKGWVKKGQLRSIDIKQAKVALDFCRDAVNSNAHDVIIFDEANSALDCGLISFEELSDIIISRPKGVSIILTGRNADLRLFSLADIVTEMNPVKYNYERGINAQKGLDY